MIIDWYSAHSSFKVLSPVSFNHSTAKQIYASHIHLTRSQKTIKYFAEFILIQRWWKIFNWMLMCPVCMSSSNTLSSYFLTLSVLNQAVFVSMEQKALAFKKYQVIINEFYRIQPWVTRQRFESIRGSGSMVAALFGL